MPLDAIDVAILAARTKLANVEGREWDMRRDMELITRVLRAIRDRTDMRPRLLEIEGVDSNEVGRHVAMLYDAGYVQGIVSQGISDHFPKVLVQDLTWQGHEFFGAIVTDDGTWQRVKAAFGPEKLATVPFKMIQNVATDALTAWAKSKMGL